MTAGVEAGDLVPTDASSSDRSRISRNGLAHAARDGAYLVVALFSVASAYLWFRSAVRDNAIGFDFEGTLWNAGTAVLEGRSPYPSPVLAEVDVGNPALYPPLLMLFVAPLTVVPWWLGVIVWTAVLGAALALALYALDVKDPRCYLLALVSVPVIIGLIWGNATLLLVPLVALAWRWRDRWVRTGVLVGLAIAAKLFLWPLVFWLLGTRRYRAAGSAALTAVGAVVVPWAVIGFDGLRSYPDLLHVAEEIYAVHGYSVATMLSALGIETQLATWGALSVGVVFVALAFVVGRRGLDEVSISLAVLAAILGSPIVWEYYYALLLVPLAIARPRFSGLWVILLLFFVTHRLPRPHLFSTDIGPGGSACCKPDGVPLSSWVFNHAAPGLWPAAGHAVLAVFIIVAGFWATPRREERRWR